jgi:hypothetical protein
MQPGMSKQNAIENFSLTRYDLPGFNELQADSNMNRFVSSVAG